MTKTEETARIIDLIERIRHLIPQVRDDGWATITRMTSELLDRVEGDYRPDPGGKVPVTIHLSPKLVAAVTAIAKIKGLREVCTDEAARIFQEECERMYDEGAARKFSRDVALSVIGLNIVEDAEEQIFEALLKAVDE